MLVASVGQSNWDVFIMWVVEWIALYRIHGEQKTIVQRGKTEADMQREAEVRVYITGMELRGQD